MTHLQRASVIIASVLVVHALAVINDWYGNLKWIDMPMHWFGGFAMAFLGFAVWNFFVGSAHIDGHGRLARLAPTIVKVGWIIGFVALVGIGWEWFEFLCDQIFPAIVPEYRQAQPNLGDTMGDLFLDLFGGLVGYLSVRRYGK